MKKCVLLLVTLSLLILVGCTFHAPSEITLPHSSEEYESGNWTKEELIAHFEGLGFHNFETVAYPSYFGDFTDEIIYVQIEQDASENDSFFTEYNDFEKGDIANSADELYICYYYIPEALTVDNCAEFHDALFGSEDGELMDYMAFAKKYDGKYVRFDAYVYDHTIYMGESEHIINVAGGDYSENTTPRCIIRIGDLTWDHHIDQSVVEKQHVKVYGKIDASQSDYYKMLYVETIALEAR